MSDDRRLRTWVERLSVLAILGSAAALAVPKRASLQRERVADQVLADVEVLRNAVYAFYSDSAYFPEAAPGAAAPEALIQYLPPSFSFNRPYGTLEYRNWDIPTAKLAAADSAAPVPSVDSTMAALVALAADTTDTLDTAAAPVAAQAAGPAGETTSVAAPTSSPSGLPAANVVGVTVTVRDGRIGATAASKAPPRSARFVVGHKYTFLFFGT